MIPRGESSRGGGRGGVIATVYGSRNVHRCGDRFARIFQFVESGNPTGPHWSERCASMYVPLLQAPPSPPQWPGGQTARVT